MRTNKLLILAAAGLLIVTSGVGCAKATKSSKTVTTAAPILPNVPGAPGSVENTWVGDTWSSGGSAKLNIVNTSVFNKWVSTHVVEPTNVMVNVNIGEVPNRGTYVGEVKIRYTHNGQSYEATLKSHTESYDGQDYFQFNKFFNYGGKRVFSGFFEDSLGAIVLVFDGDNDQGDGLGGSEISGSIWFKNFQSSYAAYDEGAAWADAVLPCWFRQSGPYDCRSNAVMTKGTLYPDRYEKLGTFTGMIKSKALNIN